MSAASTPEFDNLVQLYRESCETYADRPVFGTKRAGGWMWMRFGELAESIDHVRGGLASLGIGEGDAVAIVSDNRVEWALTAYATYGLGAKLIPMYEAQDPHDWRFILEDSGAKAVVAATQEIRDRLRGFATEIPTLQHVIGLTDDGDPTSFAALSEKGEASPAPAMLPTSDMVAGLIYTSGTTGKPKGVILTHGNITSNINAVREVFPLDPGNRSLSFLPWAHSFGQVCELHYGVASGIEIAINDAVPHLIDNLAVVKPTVLVAVPRIFNKLYDRVITQIEHRPAVIRKLFWDGIRAAEQREHGEKLGLWRKLELKLDDKLIFSKVREKFGGRLQFVISGSAALGPDVAHFIDALGIPVYEGYGLSETSPVVTCSTPDAHRVGTVGKALPGVRVDIDRSVTGPDAEDGEIIVYGPNVTQGYHNRPEETAKLFTADGGMRTGDLGRIDDDGFLHITGRIKEQYKLENGKYVMPAPLEESLKYSHYIANAMLYGANRPYNVALLVPDRQAVTEWAKDQGVPLDSFSASDQLRELLRTELEQYSANFKGYEKPKKFLIVDEDFSPSAGTLTPTLKLKRRVVVAKYGEALDELYS